MKKIVIAIDGYAGTGKGTTAKGVADKLGYVYIDSGSMYRAVTLFLLRNNVNINQKEILKKALKDIDLEFRLIQGNYRLFMNREDVQDILRSPEINDWVSKVADIMIVREFLVEQQQKLGERQSIVMDGRDIGSVVFPNADFKFFLKCDLDIRSFRRWKQLQADGIKISLEEVKQNIKLRDTLDKTRIAFLFEKYGDDVIVVDTTHLTIEKQIEKVIDYIRKQ